MTTSRTLVAAAASAHALTGIAAAPWYAGALLAPVRSAAGSTD